MATESGESLTAPYPTWGTFEKFLGGLNGTVIPSRIDRSLMKSLSGAAQSQLRGALRFFRLVQGDQDAPTPKLRTLVAAHGTPEWKGGVASLMTDYDELLDGLDRETATISQLEDAFRTRGKVAGSALEKAVRFFLTVAETGGISVSPHWKSRKVTTSRAAGTRAPRARKQHRNNGDDLVAPAVGKPPSDIREIRFPLPDKDVRMWLPEALSAAELDFVVKYLKEYQKLRKNP